MDISYQLMLFVFIVITCVPQMIENTPKNIFGIWSECHENGERLVRTPYGMRCMSTARATEKRSAPLAQLTSLDTDFSDSNDREFVSKEDDLNSVSPKGADSVPMSGMYRKVVIKNNRGPWRIDNQIFKRSPVTATTPSQTGERVEELADYQLTNCDERDGLLVNKEFVSESKPVMEAIGARIEPSADRQVSQMSDASVERQFIRNLPKINLFTKPMDRKNLRNFRFSSDIDVFDLMEDDSVLTTERQFHNESVGNVLSDRRLVRSPLFVESGEKSADSFGPIKIFVFLNRNRKTTDNWMTDASTNGDDNSPQTSAELIADSSALALKTSTSTTTSTTTTTTTTPSPESHASNEFSERIGDNIESNEDFVDSEDELLDRDVVTTTTSEPSDEATIGDIVTSAPVSRNWNFVCGKRKGFFADVENDCRTYYQCSVRGRQRWECPPGTRFNQFSSTCDWMENVNCLAFKDLFYDKISVDQQLDSTTEGAPLYVTESTGIIAEATPGYEPIDDYEDNYD